MKVSLLKLRSNCQHERIAEVKLQLENMISLSVFHLLGFNHYVTQIATNGFDLFINNNRLAWGLFQEELKSEKVFLLSIDYPP